MDLRWKDYLGKKGGGGGSRVWVGYILFYCFILVFCIIVHNGVEQRCKHINTHENG